MELSPERERSVPVAEPVAEQPLEEDEVRAAREIAAELQDDGQGPRVVVQVDDVDRGQHLRGLAPREAGLLHRPLDPLEAALLVAAQAEQHAELGDAGQVRGLVVEHAEAEIDVLVILVELHAFLQVLHGLLAVEIGVEPLPLHEVPLAAGAQGHAGDEIAVGPRLLILGIDVGFGLAHAGLDVLLEQALQGRRVLEQAVLLRGLPPDGAGLEQVAEGVVGLELDELARGAARLRVVEAVQRGQALVELDGGGGRDARAARVRRPGRKRE